MKEVRLILGILVTMVVLTVVVEGIEFILVKSISGSSSEHLSNNRDEYFTIRNQTSILVLKIVYTFLSALIAGWLGSKITKHLQKPYLLTTIILQSIAFSYAMFFSEFKDTLHILYWALLLLLVLTGIFVGSKYAQRHHNS